MCMERKSIFWLVASISVFIFSCICFYTILHRQAPDVRFNYSVNSKTKIHHHEKMSPGPQLAIMHATDKHDSIAHSAVRHGKRMLQRQGDIAVVKAVEFDSLSEDAHDLHSVAVNGDEVAPPTSIDRQTPAAVDSKVQTNRPVNGAAVVVDDEDHTKSKLITINELMNINAHPSSVGSLPENEASAQNSQVAAASYIVLDGTEEAYVDPIASADPRMRALGGGSTEDPLNTGGGNDNTTTYNDNNTVGSLPIGSGPWELLLFLGFFALIQYARLDQNKQNNI